MGATSAGVGTYPNAFCGMRDTSAMKVIPPPGHTYTGAPPHVTRVRESRTECVSLTGFSVTPARNDPPAPPMNITVHSAGSQFSLIRATDSRKFVGNSFSRGL